MSNTIDIMTEKKDYRIQILEFLLTKNPSIPEAAYTLVTDLIYDQLTTDQLDYTGIDDNKIAADIQTLNLPELENMNTEEIAETAGEVLETFSRRLVAKVLWQAIYDSVPTEADKLARDEDFQNTIVESLDF